MTRERPHGRPWPLHLLLLPAVPVLALWAGNVDEVYTLIPVPIAAWCVGGAVVLTAIVTIVQRDIRRAAMIGTGVVLWLAIHRVLVPFDGPPGLVAAVVAMAGIVLVSVRVRPRTLKVLTLVLNNVALALVVSNAAVILLNRPASTTIPLPEPVAVSATVDGPDVWYIAPDRYPGLDVLAERGVDTRGFGQELTDRGFQVVDDARANYPSTATSLASAWNAQLLDIPAGAPPTGVALELLKDPRIGRMFRDAGYTYSHLGTWLDATASSASASAVLTLQQGPEFYRAFDEYTILPTIRSVTRLNYAVNGKDRERQFDHAEHQFDMMERLASREPSSPEFVLVHQTLPHRPYIYAADGSMRGPAATKVDAYESQLAYLNSRLLGIFDLLQERREPPIIVLLPDEGLYAHDLDPSVDETDLAFSPQQLREKLSLTAAVFDPDPTSPPTFPRGTTSLNVVRWLLDRALGVHLPPFDDVSFTWEQGADGALRMVRAEP